MKQKNQDNGWVGVCLFAYVAAILLVLLLMCASSCSPKVVYQKETVIEYRDTTIRDTAYFKVPVEVEKIVTRDTASHLENSFAKSDALVSGGFLSHSLESIPQYIKIPVEVHVTDTLWRQSEVVERVKEVKVGQPISWWKRFEIGAFPWLVFSVVLLLLWTFRKFIKKLL